MKSEISTHLLTQEEVYSYIHNNDHLELSTALANILNQLADGKMTIEGVIKNIKGRMLELNENERSEIENVEFYHNDFYKGS